MKVIINGLPLFAKRLADDLAEADTNSTFLFLDTYNSIWAKIRFFLLTPFYDVVISMNGVSENSGALNWVLKRRKKLILQWMGTDSLIAMGHNKKGSIFRDYIDYGHNFVDSSWLKEEVDSLGVDSKSVPFKHIPSGELVNKYERISVFSYIAEGKADFYGYPKLRELAKSHINIPFHVYGMNQPGFETPENVHFHGWTDEDVFKKALSKSAIFLRLTKHDGNSVSVIEALACGAEVIWTFPSKHVHQLKNEEDLLPIFDKLIEVITERGLIPNIEQSKEVILTHQKEKVIAAYLNQLKKVIES